MPALDQPDCADPFVADQEIKLVGVVRQIRSFPLDLCDQPLRHLLIGEKMIESGIDLIQMPQRVAHSFLRQRQASGPFVLRVEASGEFLDDVEESLVVGKRALVIFLGVKVVAHSFLDVGQIPLQIRVCRGGSDECVND